MTKCMLASDSIPSPNGDMKEYEFVLLRAKEIASSISLVLHRSNLRLEMKFKVEKKFLLKRKLLHFFLPKENLIYYNFFFIVSR